MQCYYFWLMTDIPGYRFGGMRIGETHFDISAAKMYPLVLLMSVYYISDARSVL